MDKTKNAGENHDFTPSPPRAHRGRFFAPTWRNEFPSWTGGGRGGRLETSKKYPNAAILRKVGHRPPRPSDTPPVQEGKFSFLRFAPIFEGSQKTYPCKPQQLQVLHDAKS